MDVRLINPFINATMNVLSTMAEITCTPEKPYLKEDTLAVGIVTGIIELSGIINGTISVTFDKKSILKIVSNLFGEEFKKINDEVEDAVGELTNMISGQARRELEELNIPLKAAIPSIISGKDHHIKHYNDEPKIAIPFNTDAGRFIIEVCLERKMLEETG